MHRLFQRSVFVLSLGILVVLLGGELGLRAVRAGSDEDGAYKQINVYQQVLKKIQTDYVTDPNIGTVTNGALHGLLESLDPDSSYMNATEYATYKQHQSGANTQVGLDVSKRFGYAVIVDVTPGSPADKEHLKTGDAIEAIDGKSTFQLSLAMIRVMLQGQPGSQVVLSVPRPRKPEADKITLTRAAATPPALHEEQYDNSSILYLKPGVLTAGRVDEVAAQLKNAGKKKVLLDLRNVGEGEEAQGLRLANLFLKQGTMATLSGQKFPTQTFTADASKCVSDAPLAVLVNRGTAGAAELTAAALAGNKRADLIGERTFGEGSVQKTIELPDGGALLLSVAFYSAPNGKKILEEAVTPGIQAGPPQDQDDDDDATPAKGDPALDKALDVLKTKNA
ncbi:MAG TPA: S41 family peptidase [Acidobacteriaceae bacterium]|nr:S41 family peptidase [Acidobacteriaceae bacterium]